MKITKGLIPAFFTIFIISSCTHAVKKEDLTGKWQYVKVENPEQTPPHFVPDDELRANNPSIRFTSNDRIIMIWGGKVLSQGTYKIEYPNIVYKEELPGGTRRDIRFLIKEFEDNKLVFQTQEADPIRVTAKKVSGR